MKKWCGIIVVIVLLIYIFLTCSMAENNSCMQKRQHISSFSTSFSSSSDNRKYNIKLATSSFSWIQVNPKEELSFNKTVGLRSHQNGYKNAIVIQDGEYVEGVGGGVCQVSTTLYNAWLRAGLDVVVARGHSVPASYIEKSLDATVSEAQDLILCNNTNMAIVINGYIKDENIIFDIYGPKTNYRYEVYSKVLSTIKPAAPREEIILSFGDNQVFNNGEKDYIVLSREREGYHSASFIKVYKNNIYLYEKKIREDYYLPRSGVIGVLY